MTTLLDTGPLLAANRTNDRAHERCAEFFAHPPPGPLLLPTPVLIEASWLLNNRMGATAHASFLHDISTDLASEKMKLAELLPVDVVRMAELVHTYRDARLDSTDASVIALAERHRITQVATLDRRDFTIVRPRHCAALTLFP